MLRDNQRRAQQACTVYLLAIIASVGVCLTDGLALLLVAQDPTSSFLNSVLSIRLLLVFAKVGLTFCGFIFLLRWLRRAYYNLHQVPGSNPGYPENWAIWAWFIPISNLIRPLTIMREVWFGTQRVAGQVAMPASLLGWWWAAYVSESLLAIVLIGVGAGSTSTGAVLTREIISQAFSLLPIIFIWLIVRRITTFEHALLHANLNALTGQPPLFTPLTD
jgi:hypothetical protein